MSREAQNLLIPFRRDKKRDFAVGSGEALLASKVRQALLTEGDTARSSGELPCHLDLIQERLGGHGQAPVDELLVRVRERETNAAVAVSIER